MQEKNDFIERRRSTRIALDFPILVSWREPNGQETQEAASVREASAHGAMLEMLRFADQETELTLTDRSSNRTAKARIVRVVRTPDSAFRVVIELLRGSENFWGLEFQLKRSTSDLQDLERSLVAGNVDVRVLRDFRDAVDYVRKAAWAVQEWQERYARQRDTSTVLPLLMFERVRRATQLCKAITVELEHRPTVEGIDELSDAVDALQSRLGAH